jgi:glutamyl-tRNA synthetase
MNTYDLESAYKKRDLPNIAEVVRVAPSPTGFVHIGLLYMAVICKYIARQTGGVFILRIEDTDKIREVQGAKEEIIKQLNTFGLTYDEGLFINDEGKFVEKGEYGPYLQSERVHI